MLIVHVLVLSILASKDDAKDTQKPRYLVQYEILYWAECNIRYIALCFPLIRLHKVLHTHTVCVIIIY